MIDALSSTIANTDPAVSPSVWAIPVATWPASPNWPCRLVPPNADATAIISAAAPTITTIEPITLAAFVRSSEADPLLVTAACRKNSRRGAQRADDRDDGQHRGGEPRRPGPEA